MGSLRYSQDQLEGVHHQVQDIRFVIVSKAEEEKREVFK